MMRKFFILAVLILFASVAVADDMTAPGDASGNDLAPVLRGVNSEMGFGTVTFIGDAGGENAEMFGTTFNVGFGYDILAADSFAVGIGVSFGKMLLDTKREDSVSPWVRDKDFAPTIIGADLDLTYLLTSRLQLGINAGFDYYMDAVSYKSGSVTEEVTEQMAVAGGLTLEYYTYVRHFSFGLNTYFNYYLDLEGQSISIQPFLKYTF